MPDPTTNEFVEQFKKDWSEFQKSHTELMQLKADGKSVADLEEKLSKIDKSLDNLTEVKARQDRIETALKRMRDADPEKKEASAEDLAYKAAFTRFMSKGEEKLTDVEQKALSVNDDTSGGFMVHADLNGRIIKRIFETSPIRQYASVVTISTDALEGPTDTDEGTYGWVGETGARSQTATPKIGMWRIPTHEMWAQPATTQKLLDDAAWNPEQWLAEKTADKFARAENNAFILGDGVTKPAGILSKATVADSAALNFTLLKQIGFIKTGKADNFPDTPSSGSDPAQADPLINLVTALKGWYREQPGTAWFMHRTTIGRVRRLRDAFGRYLWDPGINGGLGQNILGYPIAEFNDMPQLGDSNKFAIGFGNLRLGYQIVDRVGIRVLRDPYTSKPLVLFYTTKRTGGDVLNYEAIKLLQFSA